MEPHLYINVGSVLKQQFYEWLVPLQCGDVETGQTWGGRGPGDCCLVSTDPFQQGLPCPLASRDPCLLNASNHRTIKIQPPQNPLTGLRGRELKVSTFSVMLLKLLWFKAQAAE